MPKIKKILLILIFVPITFYICLVALIQYDRFTSQIKPNSLASLSADSKSKHKLVLLTSGLASFWKRLELIRQAKESIELEYFIYDLDQSSRILTQELIKKSKEGIKVRILVDFSLPVFQLNPYIAAFLIKSGIEVKYYNTAKLYSLFKVQHRSHRKLLIVDQNYIVTGGRNMADDYFEISEKYNFFDTDLLIEGDIVKNILNSFNVYWNSELAMSAADLKSTFSDEELNKSLNYLMTNHEDKELLTDLQITGKKLFSESFSTSCQDVSFATDFPGSSISKRKVYTALINEAQKAQKNILIESPYFILKDEGLNEIKKIIDRGVEFKVLTNSLYSTDAYYTVSALSSNLKNLLFSGIELWSYNGKAREGESLLPARKTSVRWGLHSKRGIIDDETTLIGTFNIDPRSANLNSELVFICRNNSALAQAVKIDIENRIKNSDPVLKTNCLSCGRNLVQNADWISTLKFLVVMPIASYLDFLL